MEPNTRAIAVVFAAATIGYLHRRPGDTPHIAGMGLSFRFQSISRMGKPYVGATRPG